MSLTGPTVAGHLANTPGPTWRRVSAIGRRLDSGVNWAAFVLCAYSVALTAAELSVTFISPLSVFPMHGGIIIVASAHLAGLEWRWVPGTPRQRLAPFLQVLIGIALIRIISLTLPLAEIEPAYRYVLAGIPMALGGFLVARAAGCTLREIGLVWRMWPIQVAVIAISMAIGLLEYAVLRPAPLGPLPWTAGGVLPAVMVGLSTGFPEELIFRGLLQTTTRPILGAWNWVYASAVFAVMHIGYNSPLDLAVVFGVGLLYGWVFERSRSIVGISIGHGQANVILFFVAPNLPFVVQWLGG